MKTTTRKYNNTPISHLNCLVLLVATMLIGVSTLCSAEKAFTADKDTVELWNFDECAGTTAANEMPNAINITSKALEWGTGKFGGALAFKGDKIVLVYPVAIPLDKSVTAEAWIKIDEGESGKRMGILQNMVFKKAGFRMHISTDNHIVWNVESEGTELYVVSKASVFPGDWIHVAGTYDGQSLCVYVNGELSGTAAASTGNLTIPPTYLLIGYTDAGELPHFYGLIDAIRISNTARKEFLKP